MEIFTVIEHIEQYNSDCELVPQMEIKGIFDSFEKADEFIEKNFKNLIEISSSFKFDLGGEIVKDYIFISKPSEIGITIEKFEVQ